MHVMGIVNVTPDSFSDGGKWAHADAAVAHARELIAHGASIIDIGGESTRPGAHILSWEQEWERIAPVVQQLAGGVATPLGSLSPCGAIISVDTYHAHTARCAVEAGATIVNDVTGGNGDPDMFATVAELGCDYVLQHSRGNAQTMDGLRHYTHHIAIEVRDELLRARDRAVAAGINVDRIILDPGLGFAKTGQQDWDTLAGVHDLAQSGARVLVGASRKRFLDGVSRVLPDEPSAASERDVATAVISALLAHSYRAQHTNHAAHSDGVDFNNDNGSEHGVWAVRVHNVAASVAAIRVAQHMDSAVASYAAALNECVQS